MKIQRDYLTPKWLEIRSIFEAGDNGSQKYGTNFEVGGELDLLTRDFVDDLGNITENIGFDCLIEGVRMDVWKERIWNLIEHAGLLPEITWKEEEELAQKMAELAEAEAEEEEVDDNYGGIF